MLFILSTILLLITVLFIVSLFRLSRLSETILAWAITAFATIVLVMQAANLMHRLNKAGTVLLFQGIIFLLCLGLWLLLQRPRLFPKMRIRLSFIALFKEKSNWPLLFLLSALVFSLALFLVLIYIVPPNNNDALSIHLARVLKWHQFGSYFPWETPYFWQVTFPVNAQLTYYWTMLLTQGDHFIAYIPFLAGLATALLVYLLTLELGFNRRLAVFSAAIWLSLPAVLLHLTSVRHDLINAWLFLSCLYFFIRWGKLNKAIYMVLSALSLALVIGANFSIAAYLPGLLIMLGIWFFSRRYSYKKILIWLAAVLLAFMLFSSPIYISNMIHFNSPMGPDVTEMTSTAITSEMSLGKYIAINISRWSYQLVDFSWLPPPVAEIGVRAKAWLAEQLSGLLHINLEGDLATMDAHDFQWERPYQLQEDEAWFGLIGMALIFPTSLIAFIRGIKRKDTLLLAPFVFLVTVMVTCTLIRPGWTPYDGRYFLPLSAMCASLLPLWLLGKKSSVVIQYILSGLSVFTILMVLVFNPAKQIVGGSAIWGMNRIDQMTRQSYTTKEMLYLVEAVIPEDGTVGLATLHEDIQEYGIYGEHFERTVYEVFPPEQIASADWLRDRQIEYLLIAVSPDYPTQIAEGYRYVDSLGDWVVYSYQP